MAPTLAPDQLPAAPAGDGGSAAPRRRRRPPLRALAVAAVAAVLALVAVSAGLRLLRPHRYGGTVMQAPTAAPSTEGLFFTDGRPLDLAAWHGDVVLVYFGYTHCPDVCPTTLSKVANARLAIGEDAARVHLVMITVDPERDDPALLGPYTAAFDPTFLGATGTPEAVARVATTYGVFFARGEQRGPDDYAVDHTATLLGLDTDGHLRIVWPTDVTVEQLAGDLEELL